MKQVEFAPLGGQRRLLPFVALAVAVAGGGTQLGAKMQ
jgi:hypothetical protein